MLAWMATVVVLVTGLVAAVLASRRPIRDHVPDDVDRLRSMAGRAVPVDAPTREIDAVERLRDAQQLLGPLTPVDCDTVTRHCLFPSNCRVLCKDAAVVDFDCNDGVCREKSGSGGTTPPEVNDRCDAKNGEYGLLVGYNELGVAVWECVQMYPAFADRSRYCENGRVDIDARVREPSYRDCTCPPNHVRVVYRKSVLGSTVYGLPHCVPANLYKFYSLDYDQL